MSEENDFKNVYRLGFVSFFTDFSSEMVLSILPVYILGLPGASIATLGFIEGIAESLSYMLRAVSGIMSDKFKKRKVFILLGYGVSNLAKPFFAVTTTIRQRAEPGNSPEARSAFLHRAKVRSLHRQSNPNPSGKPVVQTHHSKGCASQLKENKL